MVLKWILSKLSGRLNRKKHEVIRLRWQQAELQRTLDQARRQQDREGVDHGTS